MKIKKFYYSISFILSIIIIKMKRDKRGRFAEKDDYNRGFQFTITFISIRNIIFWMLP